MDDMNIIALLQNNPPEGMRSLIGKYRGLVGNISSGVLNGHEEDIEEVIADTFISIWKNIAKFDPARGSLKSLLIITTRNNAINRWHKLKKDSQNVADITDIISDSKYDTLAELLAQEDAEQLQELINALPEPDREIFIRRHYLLETVQQIALRLALEEKQISNRLYQSKLRLRERLQERGISK